MNFINTARRTVVIYRGQASKDLCLAAAQACKAGGSRWNETCVMWKAQDLLRGKKGA